MVRYRRLYDLRTDNDLTQKIIAEYLEMNQTQYARYERGDNSLPVWVLEALADYYHVSTDYILGRTDVKAAYSRTKRKK